MSRTPKFGLSLMSAPPPKPAAGKDERPDLTDAGAQLAKANHCDSCHQEGYVGRDNIALRVERTSSLQSARNRGSYSSARMRLTHGSLT